MPASIFERVFYRTAVPNLMRQFGEPVTYARGSLTVTLDARFREVQFEETVGLGDAVVIVKALRVFIDSRKLNLNNSLTEPQRRDLITRHDGDKFQVVPTVMGTSWQWSSAYKHHYEISVDRYVEGG